MYFTGKQGTVPYGDRVFRFLNQRSREWTHPYEYPVHSGETLSSSGCGIFSTCHAVEVLCGERIDVEALADFSCREGGRGDDGTDRPQLLKAMHEKGLAGKYGFRYDLDGLLNDHEALWETLRAGGCALCNLRVGHIVALIDYREKDGERQVLAMDCHSESADERVRASVREVIPESMVVSAVLNPQGDIVGGLISYGLFWVPLTLAKDFNLLHSLKAIPHK